MATLTLTLRIPKGSALTHAEMDGNLSNLGQYATDLDSELRVELAGTGSGVGASLIGIEDVSGRFLGFNVEDALEEVPTSAEIGSTSAGEGAALVGVADVRTKFTGDDVEAVLAEMDDDVRRKLPTKDITNPFVISGMTYSDPLNNDLAIDILSGKFVGKEKVWDYPGVSNLTFPSNRTSYVFLTPGNPDTTDVGSQLIQTMPGGDISAVANASGQIGGLNPYLPPGIYRYLIAPLSPRLGPSPSEFGETPPVPASEESIAFSTPNTFRYITIDWSLYNDIYAGGYRVYRKYEDAYGGYSQYHQDEFYLIAEITNPATKTFNDENIQGFIPGSDGNYVIPPTETIRPIAVGNGYPILLEVITDGTDIAFEGVTDIRDDNEPRFKKVVDTISDQSIDGEKSFSVPPRISGSVSESDQAINLGVLNNELMDLVEPGHGIQASASVSDNDVTLNLAADVRHGGNVSGDGGIHLNTSGAETYFSGAYLYTAPAEVTPHFLTIYMDKSAATNAFCEVQWENAWGQVLRPYTLIAGGYEDNGFLVNIPFLFGARRLRFRTRPGTNNYRAFIVGLSFTSNPDYVTPNVGNLYYSSWYVPTGQFANSWDDGNWSHITTLDYNTSYINENDSGVNDDRIYCRFDQAALYSQLSAADPAGIEAVEVRGMCTAGPSGVTGSTVRMIIDNYGDSVGPTLGSEQELRNDNVWAYEYDEFKYNPWKGREWRLSDFDPSNTADYINCFGISAYRHGTGFLSNWISCTYLTMRVRYRR